LIYYILIALAAGTLYLTVGIALVALLFRVVPQHTHDSELGFFVIFWPLLLVCVVVVLVVSSLGKIVVWLGRTRVRGEGDW
jgi:cell division protein FtsX